MNIDRSSSSIEFAQAALNAGDAVMNRLYKYVKNDGGHIAEQIGRNSGLQTSAKDLTWSYANILSAMQQRQKSVTMLEMKKTQKQEWLSIALNYLAIFFVIKTKMIFERINNLQK